MPDLLGYGKTSRPTNVKLYTGKGMSENILEILGHERIERVVGVGHDW